MKQVVIENPVINYRGVAGRTTVMDQSRYGIEGQPAQPAVLSKRDGAFRRLRGLRLQRCVYLHGSAIGWRSPRLPKVSILNRQCF